MTNSDAQWEEFRQRIQHSFSEADAGPILRALDYLVERSDQHTADRTRAASELLCHGADPAVVTAALLVPLRRHATLAPAELQSLFGDDVTQLVEKVISIPVLGPEGQAVEGPPPLLESISGDLRAAILSIGLRLADLEVPTGQQEGQARDLAHETMDLYVPLADRLGMGALCTRLEDASFRRLEPAVYQELAQTVGPIQEDDAVCLKLLEEGIRQLLSREGIEATLCGRTKGLYSIYRKMRLRDCPVEEILDKIGLRIVVSSVAACYATLGLLHTHFRPVPGTFDDYIGLPKENGYQSLHTCIYPVAGISGKPVEIQIRTEPMHRQAEYGVAAHWRYKYDKENTSSGQEHLQWLRSMLVRQKRTPDPMAFLRELRRQVFDDRLVIFDPAGRPLRFPEGSTVADLLERVVEGEKGYIVRVNGLIQSPDHVLRDGDSVEWLLEETASVAEGESHD